MELERGLLRFKLFLSTPSARRATSASAGRKCPGSDFYPRPPRGGRHFLWRPRCKAVPISIHALREEGDSCLCRLVWRLEISIHALREEGDGTFAGLLTCPRYFYPRPPRGGRPTAHRRTAKKTDFYPRPPRGGRPLLASPHLVTAFYFYPRPPRGGRPADDRQAVTDMVFLSTPSARRATAKTEKNISAFVSL